MSLVSRVLTICLIACAAASCLGGRAAQAQDCFWHTTPQDSLKAEQVLSSLKCTQIESVPHLMLAAGVGLSGQPYVAGTLEEQPEEQLCIYLTRTDCILFVETCLALARTARTGGGFPEFADELRQSRYRDGTVTCYADRLHYTSEWILQGEKRGILKDITMELGGEPYCHPVNFMSTHPDAYPRMDDVEAIKAAEARINAIPACQIPKAKVKGILKEIQSGDIICLVSGIEGLDILHVGIAAKGGTEDTICLIHASSVAGKVIVDPKPLDRYLEGRKSVTGIRVLRPL